MDSFYLKHLLISSCVTVTHIILRFVILRLYSFLLASRGFPTQWLLVVDSCLVYTMIEKFQFDLSGVVCMSLVDWVY